MSQRAQQYAWPARSPIRLNALAALLAFAMIAVSLLVAWAVFSNQLWRSTASAQAQRVVNVATVLAQSEAVIAALESDTAPAADSAIQTRMSALRQQLDVNFIVIIDRHANRLTHPDPQWIGQHFRGGDEQAALAGQRYSSQAVGTLGTSIRGFAPVHNADGNVIGAVSVGVTLSHLELLLQASRDRLLLLLLVILAIGGLGAAWLARTIRRRLMGMEPDEIARLVAERRATLDAIHEGVIAVDAEGRVTLVNPAAQALLADSGAEEILPGRALDTLRVNAEHEPPRLTAGPMINRRLPLGGRSFLCNYQPILAEPVPVGAVITFRDSGEMQTLAEELTGVRRYAEALRASTHEFKNKLHVILGLTRLRDMETLERYLHELVDYRDAVSTPIIEQVREPLLAGFLIGKQSEAREKGIILEVVAETAIPPADESTTLHALVSIIGNLLENAFEAIGDRPQGRVAIHMALEAGVLSLQVQDNGGGMAPEQEARIFDKGFSSKGEQRGLGLWLVREQLDAVEGSLSLYSSPGEGTLIEVSYPYRVAGDGVPRGRSGREGR
ncbi:ATP-binding protein [Kushneria aurantia]|uniref:histidine kinase n=1 Tax=Kushneria aurantia TaxID=504092 RepID=A0ABV6G324_9GAMM|nr:ATP-binding protein [Kushneria aurantia]